MRGYCQSGGKMHIARAKLHYWEEPPISGTRGSGTIFFTGCSLRCAFCQNSEISGESLHGKDFTVEEFIETIKKLEAMGAHNINLVTPTHFASQIAEALRIYKPRVPVVYNCGGYESVETLRMLEGLVDIYLPDFKYADDDLAVRLSNAPHYCETALAAIHEMVRQTGENVYDENGMLQKGIIIRQLILPGHTRNSMQALELIKQHFPGRAREPDEPVYADGTCFARAGICGHQPPHHPAGEPQGTKLYVGTGFARLLPKAQRRRRTLYTGFYTV